MSQHATMTRPSTLTLSGTTGIATPYRPSLAAGLEILVQALGRGAKQASRTVTSLWVRYLTWQMRRATRMALQELDSRSLKDIGMERSEIEAFVRDIHYHPHRP
jgi:uncharacterized protein YjiS (DUF1127 family)